MYDSVFAGQNVNPDPQAYYRLQKRRPSRTLALLHVNRQLYDETHLPPYINYKFTFPSTGAIKVFLS
jgi:hypothetical protein